MNMTPKHQKVTTYSKQDDGSVKIEQKSYYEQLSQEVVEIEKPMISSFYTLKQDVDMALDHILKDGSSKLVITIETKNGQLKLVKRWVTLKNSYPKR